MNKYRVVVKLKTGEQFEHTNITETFAGDGGFYCLFEEETKQLFRYPTVDIRMVIEQVMTEEELIEDSISPDFVPKRIEIKKDDDIQNAGNNSSLSEEG